MLHCDLVFLNFADLWNDLRSGSLWVGCGNQSIGLWGLLKKKRAVKAVKTAANKGFDILSVS